MAYNQVIEISDDEPDATSDYDRRAILEPVVRRVVDALGGYEGGHYRLGDEVTGCLKDLKKLWRKDDTDDERTVARIFWDTRVLMNDLVPILLETAGKGLVEDKRAIYCADLMTAMTWPIDMAEELKELDDEFDKGTDYTQLLQSHLYYKAALLKPGVIEALFGIMLPPLAKAPHDRSERDGQVINVVLHLIRNLAFIKDLPMNIHLSSDQAELSSMQSRLISALKDTHTFSLLLTIAANDSNDRLLNSWNTLVLEIFYLLFRGVKPASLTASQQKQPAENLKRLLAVEAQNRKHVARTASSRHSHFGTTISVRLNPNKKPPATTDGHAADAEASSSASGSGSQAFILHRQQALTKSSGSIMDMTKQQKTRRGKNLDELSREENLSLEARTILQNLARDFIEGCFNPFLASILKDIRSERAKVTEKDNLRLLFVAKWFLEFFLCTRANEPGSADASTWSFGLVAEVIERDWIVWVLKRMRGAVDEKPKMWTELQAGIDCLSQLLLLLDGIFSSPTADASLKEAVEVLQQQLIYNGEVLDIAFESLRSYKQGTQSLAYLDSSVYLAYSLLRMLERWGKAQGQEMYVRRKTAKARKRAKAKAAKESGDAVPDVEDIEAEPSEEEDIVHETLFTFEAFQEKFAQADITQTLLAYLSRYKDFSSSEDMKRVVSLMHRQAVRAKAEGLYFKVSTLDLFSTILADQKSFPRDQAYKDLINLVNYILRQFFKALAEEPFLAIEAFFPKNRGNWKQFSSWKPEPKTSSRKGAAADESKFPPDVEVKKGYSWSDQLGIAISALVEAKQEALIDWVKENLTLVLGLRQRIIEETDSKGDEDDEDEDVMPKLDGPSTEAMSKFTDYMIPYVNDEQANAATKNPHLKLLLRLSKFFVVDDNADELQWYIPAGIAPSDLQSTLTVISQFLEKPFDLDGKSATQLMCKKRKRRQRRAPSRSSSSDEGGGAGGGDGGDADGGRRRRRRRRRGGDEPSDAELGDDDDEPARRRRAKKTKEQVVYKSAQFIDDSDAELGDLDDFLEKEKAQRERAERAATVANSGIGTMRSTGTKKRRRKAVDDDGATEGKQAGKKRRKSQSADAGRGASEDGLDGDDLAGRRRSPDEHARSRSVEDSIAPPPPKPRPRPRPRTRQASPGGSSPAASPTATIAKRDELPSGPTMHPETMLDSEDDFPVAATATAPRRAMRLVISDDDE